MDILTVDLQSDDAPTQFALSLKNTGFAVIRNHAIDPQLFEQVRADWEQFFKGDEALKKAYWYHKTKQDGYFPTESAKDKALNDLKEFYHVTVGGRMPPQVGSTTWELRQTLFDMGRQLLTYLQAATPDDIKKQFPGTLPDLMNPEGNTVLRIIHYPPLRGDEPEGAVRAAAHEDINLITILPAANEAGLQVFDNLGRWQTLACDPGAIVVNAGDMLQELSGHYYKSTKHRVLNPTGSAAKRSRFSTPMFIHPLPDVRLSERYPRSIDYVTERFSAQGLL